MIKDLLSVKYVIIGLLFTVAVVGIMFARFNKAEAAPAVGRLDKSIDLAMHYIQNATMSNGRFVYIKTAKPDTKYDKKEYNALRHAGTLYSMYLCERYMGNESLKSLRLKSSKYFVKNYIKKVPSIGPDIYAVVSVPEEESLKTVQAKTGGAGLALIGLSNLYPEKQVDIKVLRGLAQFIIYMQMPNGNIYAKYDITGQKKNSKFISLYYPGECALGLLYLYEVDPNKDWLDSAKRMLLFLADSRKDRGTDVEYDHWAMLATEKLFKTPDNGLTPEEKTALIKHATQMANKMIPRQITDSSNRYYGAFQGNIRPCSLGTIMEGMVSIYHIVEDEKLKLKVMRCLHLGTEFLARVQIKKDPNSYGIIGGIPTVANWTSSKAHNDAAIVRIDNVQHVMSAWITYQQLFK